MFKLHKENDAKKIEELKSKCPNGELMEIQFAVGKVQVVIYAKPPSRANYKQFKSKAKADHQSALEVLVCESVLWPEAAAFQSLLDRYPGLLDNIGGYLFESIGQSQDAEVSSL